MDWCIFKNKHDYKNSLILFRKCDNDVTNFQNCVTS